MRLHRRIGAAAVAACLLFSFTLSGCSSDSPPDGWKRTELGWVSIAIPEDWVEVDEQTTDYWTTIWQDSKGADATIQLGVNPIASLSGYDLERAGFLANVQMGTLPGFNLKLQSEPANDAGLEIGRIDYTYSDDNGDTNDGVYWAVSDPTSNTGDNVREFKTVALLLTGKNLSKDTVRLVEESIRIIESDATLPPDGS